MAGRLIVHAAIACLVCCLGAQYPTPCVHPSSHPTPIRPLCRFEVLFPRQLNDQQKAALRQILPTH